MAASSYSLCWHRRLYSFDKPSAYPALKPMITGRINMDLIRIHPQSLIVDD
jgi:hypothetical protein